MAYLVFILPLARLLLDTHTHSMINLFSDDRIRLLPGGEIGLFFNGGLGKLWPRGYMRHAEEITFTVSQ